MIDVEKPDYTNTPASDTRPPFSYGAAHDADPLVSIITPYYNTGPVFFETVRSILRMSFAYWEWIIVDDGSTDPASVDQLERVQESDPRIRVMRQRNGGPAAARNCAVRESRGKYLLQLDSDDLIEPTFVEKALWVLETQRQFAICNGWNVTFGSKNYLWSAGFQDYETNLQDNKLTNQAVISRAAFLASGGYDESIKRGHEDWDMWLNMAEAGYWGYTIPEYLTWYRWNLGSRRDETARRRADNASFHRWLLAKHRCLLDGFPHPMWTPSLEMPQAPVEQHLVVQNALSKPAGVKRVLLVVPWLEIGGADKFSLDIIHLLNQRGYEFTVVTTRQADDAWLHQFANLTPDIFRLNRFLHYADYPRFLDYLIQSRQIDAVLISNSELGYALVPYLRAHNPDVAFLDYTHSETENWKNGGYPGMAVRLGRQLDLNVTNTLHLKRWMVGRGGDPERIAVCHCGVDTEEWCKDHYDVAATRRELGVEASVPLVLFVGRFSFEKRPLLFAKIMQRVTESESRFVALMVGSGEQASAVESYVRRHHLERQIRLLGALPNAKVRELMAAGDIIVVPSEIEGLALVLFEAMAMETVPVAVDIAGHPELVTPDCGYLLPRSDKEVDLYAAAVLRLIHDPDLRGQMAVRGRRRVAAEFGLGNLAERMDAAIQQARDLVRERPTHDRVDLDVVHHATHIAVENMRLEELADFLWAQRTQSARHDIIRRARQAILPIGTQRYEVYKRFRQRLRSLAHALMRRRHSPAVKRPGDVAALAAAAVAPIASAEEDLRLPAEATAMEETVEVPASHDRSQ